MDSGKINKKYKLGVLKLLKIWKNYYLDASSVYYALKKAHTKADGGVEYDFAPIMQGWRRHWQKL